MSDIKCPACGEPTEQTAQRCKHCEAALPPKTAGTGDYLAAGSMIALLLGGAIAWYTLLSGNEPELTPAQIATQQRVDQIERQFSPFNGSHRNLVDMVKRNMNDPDSFEHVETRYGDDGDSIRVRMVYRGRNAFGGTVTETVVARASINGEISEIISQ